MKGRLGDTMREPTAAHIEPPPQTTPGTLRRRLRRRFRLGLGVSLLALAGVSAAAAPAHAAEGYQSCVSGRVVQTNVWSQASQDREHWIEYYGYTHWIGVTGSSSWKSNRNYSDWAAGANYLGWYHYYTQPPVITANASCPVS